MPAGGRQKAATRAGAVRRVEPYAAKRGRRACGALVNQRAALAALRHQIRRLVVYVHPVVLSAVCAAQVRGRIQLDRQSPVWYFLVD
jgi:hypothetical protein